MGKYARLGEKSIKQQSAQGIKLVFMQPKQIYVKRVDTSKPPCYNEGNIFIICNTSSYKETISRKEEKKFLFEHGSFLTNCRGVEK